MGWTSVRSVVKRDELRIGKEASNKVFVWLILGEGFQLILGKQKNEEPVIESQPPTNSQMPYPTETIVWYIYYIKPRILEGKPHNRTLHRVFSEDIPPPSQALFPFFTFQIPGPLAPLFLSLPTHHDVRNYYIATF